VRIITSTVQNEDTYGTDLVSMRSCCWGCELSLWAWNSLLGMEGLQGRQNRSDLQRRRNT